MKAPIARLSEIILRELFSMHLLVGFNENLSVLLAWMDKQFKAGVQSEEQHLDHAVILTQWQEMLRFHSNYPASSHVEHFNWLLESLRIPFLLYASELSTFLRDTASQQHLEIWEQNWREFYGNIERQIKQLSLVETGDLSMLRFNLTQMIRFIHELKHRYYSYPANNADGKENVKVGCAIPNSSHRLKPIPVAIHRIAVEPYFDEISKQVQIFYSHSNSITGQSVVSLPLLDLLNRLIARCAFWAFDQDSADIVSQAEVLRYANDKIVSRREIDVRLHYLTMLKQFQVLDLKRKEIFARVIYSWDDFTAVLKKLSEYKNQYRAIAEFIQRLQTYLIFRAIVPTGINLKEFLNARKAKSFGQGNLQDDIMAIDAYIEILSRAMKNLKNIGKRVDVAARNTLAIRLAIESLSEYKIFCETAEYSAADFAIHNAYIQMKHPTPEFLSYYPRLVLQYFSIIFQKFCKDMQMMFGLLKVADPQTKLLDPKWISETTRDRQAKLRSMSQFAQIIADEGENAAMQRTTKLLRGWRSQVERCFQDEEPAYFDIIETVLEECKQTQDPILVELQHECEVMHSFGK